VNRNQALVIVFAILIGFAGVYFYGQPKTGTLQVNVSPDSLHPKIAVDGAVIGSAPVEKTLSVGNHTVVAGDVSGYVTPKPLKVAIEQGRKTTVTFTYATAGTTPPTQTTGILYVKTDPVEGEIFVQGQSKGKGAIMVDLAPGSYLVTFGAVAGYTAPAGQTAIVQSGQMTTIMVKYQVVASPSKATVSVTTQPVQGPILIDGVQRGVGSVDWQVDVGATVKVSFGYVLGYVAPVDQIVVASEAKTCAMTGVYSLDTRITGTVFTIEAYVFGTDRVLTGAPIYVDGVYEGTGSVKVTGLSGGSHTITWGEVSGYTKPDPIVFTNTGENMYFQGNYVVAGVAKYSLKVAVEVSSSYSSTNERQVGTDVVVKTSSGTIVERGKTDINGEVVFRLPSGTYLITAVMGDFYIPTITANVPSDSFVTLVIPASNLSIIPIGGFAVESSVLVVLAFALLLVVVLWRPRRGYLRRRR
jgi:hypothetical protein